MVPEGLNPVVAVLGNNEVTKTYRVDTFNKRIVGTTDGQEALEQAILKNMDTERYSYVIYTPNYAIELVRYIGKDIDFIRADLRQTLEECLLVDNRIYALSDLQIEQVEIDVAKILVTLETSEGVLVITKEIKI